MASRSRSRTSPPYRLYLRKKDQPSESARTLFVFCRARNDAKAAVQKWIYGGLTYADWQDACDNPLLNDPVDMVDTGLYGYVDAAQVETPNSALQKIIALSTSDLDKFTAAWNDWFDARINETLRKGKGREGEMCKEDVEKDIREKEGRQWEASYFKTLASNKIDELYADFLLKC
ncbi:hypothetical protein LMH87_000375 [Akanthomyces muscarius]|uniref:Uncharacterized protein n=1 Tax=Akanthomyces muscarius TaxID=2231603 RepID=A0A9W8QF66_AKAMU|nr:hypothetical protein LMH87_000375 [Akanthomyces muscarius]KAJ4155111.1 hypothetical protein LMH87_000375 [Akanthomyces muscarius]